MFSSGSSKNPGYRDGLVLIKSYSIAAQRHPLSSRHGSGMGQTFRVAGSPIPLPQWSTVQRELARPDAANEAGSLVTEGQPICSQTRPVSPYLQSESADGNMNLGF